MHLAGIQVGQGDTPNQGVKRLEKDFLFGIKAQWRIGIQFYLNLDGLFCLESYVEGIGIVFEESRFHLPKGFLVLLLNSHLAPRQLEGLYNLGEIVLQMYLGILLCQREIHVFRKTSQVVEDSEACATIALYIL